MALEAQNKTNQLADVQSRFQRAWADADIELTSSRF
jgi:hypothetical protein